MRASVMVCLSGIVFVLAYTCTQVMLTKNSFLLVVAMSDRYYICSTTKFMVALMIPLVILLFECLCHFNVLLNLRMHQKQFDKV